MTMLENKCDVCRVNAPIGVASTAIPLSVAYCQECAKRNAQPIDVFLYWEDEIGHPKNHANPGMVTFIDGQYINYRKWYDARHKRKVHIKEPKGSEPTKS